MISHVMVQATAGVGTSTDQSPNRQEYCTVEGVTLQKVIIHLLLIAVAPVVFLSGCGTSVRMNLPSMKEIQRVDVETGRSSNPVFTSSKDPQVISSILDDLKTATVIGKESNPNRSIVVLSMLLKDGSNIRLFPEYASNKPVVNQVIYIRNGTPNGEVIVLESAPLWNWLMGGWTKSRIH